MNKYILLIILFFNLFSFNATAEIYRSVDSKGNVTYSDQPNITASKVTLPAANIVITPVKAPKTTNTSNAAATATEEKRENYTTFVISSPSDQATFQNAESVPISVDIKPALQKGDTLNFYWDGKSVSSNGTNTAITVPKVSNNTEIITRGSHTIYAEIASADGAVIATTPSITIFTHYASTLNKQ